MTAGRVRALVLSQQKTGEQALRLFCFDMVKGMASYIYIGNFRPKFHFISNLINDKMHLNIKSIGVMISMIKNIKQFLIESEKKRNAFLKTLSVKKVIKILENLISSTLLKELISMPGTTPVSLEKSLKHAKSSR